ncbi:hypothetical protein FXV83_40565 [Bradyrhizobium hipponense]|uniref:Uncharacterized protein n=1 Tax=Bradyrhizobium hipponense TaxID=2605638 RepID=A0A5S4YAG5_9BRAD|nr:hypothetical protein [Bradyrhizobium hipponense]TYO61008.1 hypothetical protein FXV83_40565 [Bradyrhizobium hipponense]
MERSSCGSRKPTARNAFGDWLLTEHSHQAKDQPRRRDRAIDYALSHRQWLTRFIYGGGIRTRLTWSNARTRWFRLRTPGCRWFLIETSELNDVDLYFLHPSPHCLAAALAGQLAADLDAGRLPDLNELHACVDPNLLT